MSLSEITTVVELIRNILLTLAAIAGMYIGFTGLNVWKRERNWNEDRQLAKSILSETIRVRDMIRAFRFQGISFDDLIEVMGDEGIRLTDGVDRKTARRRIYEMRFEKIADAHQKIYALEVEAVVLWDEDILPLLGRLRYRVMDIRLAMDDSPCFREPDDPPTKEERARSQSILSGSRSDEFSSTLDNTVDAIVAYLKPKLGRRT